MQNGPYGKYLGILAILYMFGCLGFVMFFIFGANKSASTMPNSFNWYNENLKFIDSLYDQDLEPYTIDGYVFSTDIVSRDTAHGTYSFYVNLESFALGNDDGVVTVNNVKVSGNNAVKFQKVDKTLNQVLEYSPVDFENNISQCSVVLVDELNGGIINASLKSQILVTVNVTVTKNGQSTTKDLEYTFRNNLQNADFKRFPLN